MHVYIYMGFFFSGLKRWLIALLALAEDPGLVPNPHLRQLTTILTPAHLTQAHMHAHAHK